MRHMGWGIPAEILYRLTLGSNHATMGIDILLYKKGADVGPFLMDFLRGCQSREKIATQ